jgi:hypothetical protein
VDSFFDLKMKSLAARRCARNTYLRMHGQRMSGAAGGHENDPHAWLHGFGLFPPDTPVRYEGGLYTVKRPGLENNVVVISDGTQEKSVACSELMPLADRVHEQAHMSSLYPPHETVQVKVDGAEGPELKAAFVRGVLSEEETFCGAKVPGARTMWLAKVDYVLKAGTENLSTVVCVDELVQAPYCVDMKVTLKGGTGLVGTIIRVNKEEYTVRWADRSITKERFSKVSALPVPG